MTSGPFSAGYYIPGYLSVWSLACRRRIYVADMVDDENRQLSLRLDEMPGGVGAGIEWLWRDNWRFDASLNYIGNWRCTR